MKQKAFSKPIVKEENKASSTASEAGNSGNGYISSKDRPRGLGLLGMKERIELMDGTLSIQSRSRGGGTEIDIEIPLI